MFRRASSAVVKVAAPAQGVMTQQRNRALPPFGVFLKQSYADPVRVKQLRRILPVTARGKLIAKWYRALPTKEINKLKAAGQKMKVYRKKATKAEKKDAMRKKGLVRPPTKYQNFVKKQNKTNRALKNLPIEKRMKKIAQLWNMMK